MQRFEGYFKGRDDQELFYQTWKQENSRATLVVTHGLGEHSECYLRLVEGIKDLPIDIVAWDLRGHGRSEGKRGVVKDLANFSDDLVCFLEFLKKDFSKKPILFLSHSLGGLIVLNMLNQNPQIKPHAAAFSSPLLGVQVEVPQFKKTGAKYLAQYFPNFTLWNEIKHTVLSHDKDIVEEFDKDPLRHDRISAKLYLDMLAYTEKIQETGDNINFPTFFQLAGKDLVVSTQKTVKFFGTIKFQDKTLKIYENSYHEIFNDIEREDVFTDLKEWLKKYI